MRKHNFASPADNAAGNTAAPKSGLKGTGYVTAEELKIYAPIEVDKEDPVGQMAALHVTPEDQRITNIFGVEKKVYLIKADPETIRLKINELCNPVSLAAKHRKWEKQHGDQPRIVPYDELMDTRECKSAEAAYLDEQCEDFAPFVRQVGAINQILARIVIIGSLYGIVKSRDIADYLNIDVKDVYRHRDTIKREWKKYKQSHPDQQ